MKYTPFITILTVLLAVGCAKQETVGEQQPAIPENAVSFSGTLRGEWQPAAPDTKTSYEDKETSVSVNWLEGDQVGIFCNVEEVQTAANLGYATTQAGATTAFTALSTKDMVLWNSETAPHDFYAYYPYAETADGTTADFKAVPVTLPAVQEYDEVAPMAHLAENGFIYGSATGQVWETVGDGSVPLEFRHLFPLIEVRLTADRFAVVDAITFRCENADEKVSLDEGATVDLTTGALSCDNATGTPQTSLQGGLTALMNKPVSAYMLLSPGHAGQKFFVDVTIGESEYKAVKELTVPEDGLQGGTTYIVNVDLAVNESDAEPVTDLSANGTANSYYVTIPGTLYSFDATVKGNGEQQYALEETTIEPKSLLVLWYTCLQTSSEPWARNEPILVETLTLGPDGRAYFKTPVAFVPGNVVIVALDKELDYDTVDADETTHVISNANVLWSWNLVVAEGYDPMAAENQYQKGGYIFMSRDLGAFFDSEDALIDGATNMFALAGTAGNCYQWGRKDPFPAFPCYDSGKDGGLAFTPAYTLIPALDRGTIPADGTGRPAYNQIFGNTSGTIPLDVTGKTYSTTAEFVQEQTQNPHLWLRAWSIPGDDKSNLWGNPDGDNIGVKTIHDPCPPGYRVMTRAAWNALTENQAPSLAVVVDHRRGILLDGSCYFPVYGNIPLRTIEGICQGDRGCFNYTGNGGRTGLWTAEMTAVSFYGGGKNPGDAAEYTTADNPNLMQGCSVRCIRTLYTGVLPGTDGDGNLVDLGREDW